MSEQGDHQILLHSSRRPDAGRILRKLEAPWNRHAQAPNVVIFDGQVFGLVLSSYGSYHYEERTSLDITDCIEIT